MTQGCIVANLLNCTAVCPRCGKSEVNNIATTGKSVTQAKLTDKLKEVKPNTTCHKVVKIVTTYEMPFRKS